MCKVSRLADKSKQYNCVLRQFDNEGVLTFLTPVRKIYKQSLYPKLLELLNFQMFSYFFYFINVITSLTHYIYLTNNYPLRVYYVRCKGRVQ